MEIPREEFRGRQRRATEEADRRGLRGLMVWSRGGSTQDRYGDVLYLSNYYPLFPNIPDSPPTFRGRGHAVLLLPVDGAPVLVSDEPADAGRTDWAVKDCRFGSDLVGLLAKALEDSGMSGGRVGLVGFDVLPVAWYVDLLREFPSLRLSDADDVVAKLRMVKSRAEMAVITKGVKGASKALRSGMEAVAPGRTEGEIAAGLAAEVIGAGLCYRDLVISSGEHSGEYSHGRLPSWEPRRKLRRGDLFHVDLECSYGGYYYDMARTAYVGGRAPSPLAKALDATVEAVEASIAGIREGATAEEVGEAGFRYLKGAGYLEGLEGSDFPAMGHGLGLGWEKPYLAPGDTTRLVANMYLAVEDGLYVDGQGTMHEENLLLTPKGVKVLSAVEKGWW